MQFKLIHKILLYVLSITLLTIMISVVVFFRIEKAEIQTLGFVIYNPIYFVVKAFTLKYYIIVYFIFVFLINIVVLVVYILILRKYRLYIDEKKKKLYEKFEDIIINYIYVDFNNSSEENIFIRSKVKPLIRSIFEAQLFINKLIEINKQVEGENRRKLGILFKELVISKYVVAFLYSPYWHHKIFALRVFSEFDVSTYNSYILKLTKSKNEVLRAEANIALVNLAKRSNPIAFLDEYPYYLNKWEQTLIKGTLERKRNRLVNLIDYIDSNNYSISEFAISLAGFFEATRYRTQIISKLNHKDYRVRFASINALSKFGNPSDMLLLTKIYSKEIFVNKKAILKAIINTPNEDVYEFLICIIEKEDVRLKLLAAKALKKMNELFGMSIEVLLNYTSDDIKQIAMQTMDERI